MPEVLGWFAVRSILQAERLAASFRTHAVGCCVMKTIYKMAKFSSASSDRWCVSVPANLPS